MSDFNAKIIDEFRANAGKVGGPFEGAPVLILHTRGAKTGEERVNPVVYQPIGDALAVHSCVPEAIAADQHWQAAVIGEGISTGEWCRAHRLL